MHYFIVNIFNHYFFHNEDDDHAIKNFYLHTEYFQRETYDDNVEGKVISAIILSRGDGMDIKINSIENLH